VTFAFDLLEAFTASDAAVASRSPQRGEVEVAGRRVVNLGKFARALQGGSE
jgi:hypothetical protein